MSISGSQKVRVAGKMMIGEEKLMKRLCGQVEPYKHGLDYLRR